MQRKAIVGGTLIDGSGRPPIEKATILLNKNRVDAVFRAGECKLPKDTQIIDADGGYVIPGLIDCHVHVGVLADNSFMSVDDPAALTDLFMRSLISHGITTVRDTGNFDPISIYPQMKRSRPNWPRFFGAGTILEGPSEGPAPWRWMATISDEASARRETRKVIEQGLDFVKLYIWVRLPEMRAAISEAHAAGVRVAAHVGHRVTAGEAINAGIDALEHIRIGRELLTNDGLIALKKLPGRSLDALVDFRAWRYIDPNGTLAKNWIDRAAERGTFITPTLTLSRSILKGNNKDVMQPEGGEEIPLEIRNQWNQYAYSQDYSEEDWKSAPREFENQLEFIGIAKEAGVKITAGTDLANPFIMPGRSLHDEITMLVENCGFSPIDALRASSAKGAELLGQADDLGIIEKRKIADLLILDKNPLENIRNTRCIRTVIKDGEVVNRTI
jgi:imidazolonepropionase-like amidohydrolase